jgi:WD40 repeat protein
MCKHSDKPVLRLHLSAHDHAVTSLTWAMKQGRVHLAVGCEDKIVRVFDVAFDTWTYKLTRSLEMHDSPVRSVEWTKDANRLATGGDDAAVRVVDTTSVDVAEWRVIWRIDSLQMGLRADAQIRSVAWSPSDCTQVNQRQSTLSCTRCCKRAALGNGISGND